MHTEKKIVIAGCGLVGSLLGLRLLQRGFDVELHELRPDMRKENIIAGRSINLALSHRGIRALNLAGVDEIILSNAIQMHGRMIHTMDGTLALQAYSSRPGEFINSISRRTLNVILMDAIEKLKPGAIHFKSKFLQAEDHYHKMVFENEEGKKTRISDCILIGTDGAASAVRRLLFEMSSSLRFNYSQVFQNYGYKELTIPPGPDLSFKMEKNALHIWPRGHFMMIGLPNPDATYTATLFLPYQGNDSFEALTTQLEVKNFFEHNFPDAVPFMPDLLTEYFEHPTGHLYTVKCLPWYYENKILLMGDAAHAIIPFYGQGMNCGFEDVFVFDQLLDRYNDWHLMFDEFTKLRKPNSDAIADLAEDNFIEMRDKVADPVFQRKRQLEMELEKHFPEYYSKYALVTFRPDVSYHDAMIKGRKQDAYLMNECRNEKNEWQPSELKYHFRCLHDIV